MAVMQVGVGPLLRLDQDNYLQRSIFPYLLHGTGGSDLWIVGKGGEGVTINAFFATHILNLAPFDCVLVPDVEGHLLENLGELLHTGRFSILVCENFGLIFLPQHFLSRHQPGQVSGPELDCLRGSFPYFLGNQPTWPISCVYCDCPSASRRHCLLWRGPSSDCWWRRSCPWST